MIRDDQKACHPRHMGGKPSIRPYSSIDFKSSSNQTQLPHRSLPQPPISRSFPTNPSPFLVYCGNLPYSTSENDLSDTFSKFGTIKNIQILKDHQGRSKGTAFVELSSEDECQAAIKEMDGSDLGGRQVRVNMSRGGGGGGGGGGGFRSGPRGGGDRSCYTCGEPGHLSYDCPQGGGGGQRSYRRGGGGGGYGGNRY